MSHRQGVPLLKNRAMTREKRLNSLINVSIEKASLASNIVNAQTIPEAEKGTVETSKNARSRPSPGLTAIFPKGGIASPMQAILDAPMSAIERSST